MASTEIENFDPTATVDKINKIAADRATNRRRFISALGMAGAAAGAAALMSGCSNASTSNVAVNTSGVAQTNILNFILNVQYLEATFYSYLTTGADISGSAGVNLSNSGAITGAPAALTVAAPITQQILDLLNEIYFDEINHVSFLQGILGSAAVPRPAINLAAFGAITTTNAATNAIGIARLLEDVTITSYASAMAGLGSSNTTYSGQILGAESFHSGVLRLICIQNPSILDMSISDGLDVTPNDLGSPAIEATGPTATGGFFASIGGAIASTNTTQGLAYSRTTSQVLGVLYGAVSSSGLVITPASAGSKSGGFFPSGVNGAITTI
jgi:hypothetical protein